ncbi:hypothetical protein FRC07_005317 [Ceratobasidium sp. 392]|nr:hypothetical protein FRC07_005317 [Ceratobasidium sp. 392]
MPRPLNRNSGIYESPDASQGKPFATHMICQPPNNPPSAPGRAPRLELAAKAAVANDGDTTLHHFGLGQSSVTQDVNVSNHDASNFPIFVPDHPTRDGVNDVILSLEDQHRDNHLVKQGYSISTVEAPVGDRDSVEVLLVPGSDEGSLKHSPDLSTSPIPRGLKTVVQATDPPDAHATRSPSRSASAPAAISSLERRALDAAQAGEKNAPVRGASLPVVHRDGHDLNVPIPVSISSPTESSFSKTLFIEPTEATKLHILVIASSHRHHTDSERKLLGSITNSRYLLELPKHLNNVTVESISDESIPLTRSRVDEAIAAGWKAVASGSIFLVFLAAHGSHGAMDLDENGQIDAPHLDDLFRKLLEGDRNNGREKQLEVGVIFDICRDDPQPEEQVMRHAHLVWSSSAGQKAHDIGYDFDKHGLPASCFLLGFLLASYDTRHCSEMVENHFEQHLKARVAQFARLKTHIEHVCRCEDCKLPKDDEPADLCPKAFERDKEQVPDLARSPRFLNNLYLSMKDGLYDLAKKTYDFMSTQGHFQKCNNPPLLAHPAQGTNGSASQASCKLPN